MNPVVASSLVSLGKKFLNGSPPPQGRGWRPSSFGQPILRFGNAGSSDSQPSQPRPTFRNSTEGFASQDPTVASFIQENPNCQIFLQKRADGTMQLGSSSGQSLVLEKESPVNQTCLAFFEQSMLNGTSQSPLRPDAVILKS